MFSLICAWIYRRVNNREAGDLGRQRAHYDVTVIVWQVFLDKHNATSYDAFQAVVMQNLSQLWIGLGLLNQIGPFRYSLFMNNQNSVVILGIGWVG